jgi:hypothetical protein
MVPLDQDRRRQAPRVREKPPAGATWVPAGGLAVIDRVLWGAVGAPDRVGGLAGVQPPFQRDVLQVVGESVHRHCVGLVGKVSR